jgi:hypothetical protein
MTERVAPRSARSTLAFGELVGAASGLGLLVVSFLPWYSVGDENATAWQAFSVVDLFIAAAAVTALSVGICVVFRISVSYPVAGSTVTTLFGSIALILIAYRLVNPPGSGLDLEYGAWLGLLAAASVTACGYLAMQEPSGRRAAAPSAG